MKLLNYILLLLFKLGWSIKRPISGSYRIIGDYDYHYPWRGGEANPPMQWYSKDNIIKEDDKFTIIIKKEVKENWNYTNKVTDIYNFTSGLMYSKEKFMYGSFEADILIPEGHGFWSAFWLFGSISDSLKRFGEIDIFEYYGKKKKFAYNTHFGTDYEHNKSKGAQGTEIPELENNWYKYRLKWGKKYLKIYINDKLVGIRSAEGCDLPMKLIFNMAIENDITNELDKFLPSKMLIKNIKYYENC